VPAFRNESQPPLIGAVDDIEEGFTVEPAAA
jgi:hypothetical protein